MCISGTLATSLFVSIFRTAATLIALHTLFKVASSALCVCVGGLVDQPAASESVFLKDE